MISCMCSLSSAMQDVPVHHVIGNHCLAVGRQELVKRLNIPLPGYYRAPLSHGWWLVVLDTTEMSTYSDYPPVRSNDWLITAHDKEQVWGLLHAPSILPLLVRSVHFSTSALIVALL
jgi:hypothetical protein